MLSFPVQIRPTAAPERRASAWLLPGRTAGLWLDLLCRWPGPAEDLTLYVVPGGVTDPAGRELLVVPPVRPDLVPVWALPFGLEGDRLLLPVCSCLDPPVTTAELQVLLAEHLHLLHPAAGLVGLEPDDALRVADLLRAPPRRHHRWDRAHPGLAAPPPITRVEAPSEPSVESLLEEGRGDLASRGLEELPDGERDLSQARRLGRRSRFRVAQAVRWLTTREPGEQLAAGWVASLREWAEERVRDLDPSLAAARHRELQRLLELLRQDPDEGLRYAPPLASQASRGLARPGARLARHDVDFDERRLRRADPADPWTVSWETERLLTTRYRELAQREARLGRHRRAAYILAELLGDPEAAALALVEGEHHREAAVLYRDHLDRPLQAARCLEAGGHLTEAIPLYVAEGELEQAAGLLLRLEQPEPARRLYRQAVARKRERGDHLAAAALLEGPLEAPQEALEELRAAWPGSEQATACLRERFLLLGRLERHEEALALAAELHRGHTPDHVQLPLAQALGPVALAYPLPRVRTRVGDLVRVVVGRRLPAAGPLEQAALLQTVREASPRDLLLARDTVRYQALERQRHVSQAQAPHGRAPQPVRERTIQLGPDVEWCAAAAGPDCFHAVGYSERGVVALRGHWSGQIQRVTWSRAGARAHPLRLAVGASVGQQVLLVAVGAPPLTPARFPATDSLPASLAVGTPGWLDSRTLALTRAEEGSLWTLLGRGDRLLLRAHAPGGEVLESRELPFVLPSLRAHAPGVFLAGRPVHLLVRRGIVHVTLGRGLHRLLHQKPTQSQPLEQPVVRLAGSMLHSRPLLALSFPRGGILYRCGHAWESRDAVAAGMESPVCGFTRGGNLVAVTQAEGLHMHLLDGRLTRQASFAPRASQPVAVLPTTTWDGFAVLTTDGLLDLYRLGEG